MCDEFVLTFLHIMIKLRRTYFWVNPNIEEGIFHCNIISDKTSLVAIRTFSVTLSYYILLFSIFLEH